MAGYVPDQAAIRKGCKQNARLQGMLGVTDATYIAIPPVAQPLNIINVGGRQPALSHGVAVDLRDGGDILESSLPVIDEWP
jgi:hypothetical protein